MNKEEVNIGNEKFEEYLCDSIVINDESYEKPSIINYKLKVKTAYKLTTFITIPEEASLIYLDFSFNNFNYRFNGDDFLIYDEFVDVNTLK